MTKSELPQKTTEPRRSNAACNVAFFSDLNVCIQAEWQWPTPVKDNYEQILRGHAQAMLLVASYSITRKVRALLLSELRGRA